MSTNREQLLTVIQVGGLACRKKTWFNPPFSFENACTKSGMWQFCHLCSHPFVDMIHHFLDGAYCYMDFSLSISARYILYLPFWYKKDYCKKNGEVKNCNSNMTSRNRYTVLPVVNSSNLPRACNLLFITMKCLFRFTPT